MRIALHAPDKTKFPNLALMKLSAHHRARWDSVEWYDPLRNDKFDLVYSSKIFSWRGEDAYLWHPNVIKGGSGYNLQASLPDEIEHACPDYSLYGLDYSVGFLTRGCIRSCPWCIVPEKEGKIREHADIDEFLRHDKAVLLDNNVLAHEHGIEQIEKIIQKKTKVDFCQGLDARLIDNATARLLSRVNWLEPLRLACDSSAMIEPVHRAVELLRWHNTTPSRFSVYVLVKDPDEALGRIKYLKGLYLDVFAQAYRDREGTAPTQEQKDLQRWCDMKAVNKKCTFEDYVARNN